MSTAVDALTNKNTLTWSWKDRVPIDSRRQG
jgi:hypothetical protein